MSPYRLQRMVAELLLATSAFGFLVVVFVIVACEPGMPTPAEQARVGTYGAELAACVELATTLDESKACRGKVSAKYGRDGGP